MTELFTAPTSSLSPVQEPAENGARFLCSKLTDKVFWDTGRAARIPGTVYLGEVSAIVGESVRKQIRHAPLLSTTSYLGGQHWFPSWFCTEEAERIFLEHS